MGNVFTKGTKRINEQNIKKLLDIQSIIDITNRNLSNFTNNIKLSQAMNITFNNVKGKNIQILQDMVGILNVNEAIENADTTELTDDIKNAIDTQLSNVLDEHKKDLALLFPDSNETNIISNIESEIRKVANTTITKENVDKSLNELDASQSFELVVNGSEIDGLKVGQNLQITMLANKMVNNFSKNLAESDIASDIQDRIDNQETKKTEFESPLQTFTNFLSKYWIIIGIIAVVLIIGIVVMYYFFIRSPIASSIARGQEELMRGLSESQKELVGKVDVGQMAKLASGLI
jgi:hypothetical protein